MQRHHAGPRSLGTTALTACIAIGILAGSSPAADPQPPGTSLRENLRPTPVRSLAAGQLALHGETTAADGSPVLVRVTTSAGDSHEARVPAAAGRFSCRYPADFPGAHVQPPLVLFVDATTAAGFSGRDLLAEQAEILLVLTGDDGPPPDLPLIFTDDFLDAAGRADRAAASWPRQRQLVNLFMRGRGAALMGIRREDFDLDREPDARWFRGHVSPYDFDHRDRDWSQPLGHRVGRGFWQAMRNEWFNASNDHPWDGDPAHTTRDNYRPYAFANDMADLLVLYQRAGRARPVVADNRVQLRDDVLANLLAMQHRTADSFALPEPGRRPLQYTAGSFRYGMFETGEFLTEGKGWFANPEFRDFDGGGVFNGRCIWALGESLRACPRGPQATAVRAALQAAVAYCLRDAVAHGYARRTRSGGVCWGPPGEHGYLLLGLLAAVEADPELPLTTAAADEPQPLRQVCADALDTLVDTVTADGTWSHYANVEAVNITALATGVRVLADHPHRDHWRRRAVASADVWLGLRPLPAERTLSTPLFGERRPAGMTYYLGDRGLPHFALYYNGHWIDALARLFRVTGDVRYRDRARAILGYFCGDNPLHARILSEIGAVNNRVTDSDRNGVEDHLGWDAYPEATAFVQIGLLELLEADR